MTAHHDARVARIASIGIALWLTTVTGSAAEPKAVERLGVGTQWFLTFINDPYGVKVEEIEKTRADVSRQSHQRQYRPAGE